MNLPGFDANEVDPNRPMDLIPAGKYKAVISASEEKQTKKGDGSYLALTFTIVDGEYDGRKVFANLNLKNPNDQAVGIARADLSAICRSVGVTNPGVSADLHDIPLLITVKIKPANGEYEARNEIKGYEPVESPPTTPSSKANVGGQKAGATSDGKMPWAAKKK